MLNFSVHSLAGILVIVCALNANVNGEKGKIVLKRDVKEGCYKSRIYCAEK